MAPKKSFHTNLKKFYLLMVPGMICAAALIWFGCVQYPALKFDSGDFPPGWIFYYVPWSLGGLLILAILGLFYANNRKSIIISPQYLEFQHYGRTVFRCSWGNLSFTPPRQDRKRFKTAVISDGEHFERLEEFFYPDFELVVDVIREAKRHARDELST